jgi:DNA mismatch repair protein MutS
MSILEEYIEIDKKYKNIYGNETVVLMEVGDFFEIYGVQNEFENVGANMHDISEILNIRVTCKNKSLQIIDRKNHLLSGFPKYVVEKHIQTLIENQYTVVLVEQFENENTKYYKQFDRKVSKIITPSTYFNNNSLSLQNPCNYLMVCYWEPLKYKSQEFLSLGISLVDVTTGNTFFYECVNQEFASITSTYSLEEVYRICQMYNPSEIIHISFGLDVFYKKKITEYLQSVSPKTIERYNIEPIYKKIKFQEEILKKSYLKHLSFVSPIDVLKLDMKPLATISFCYMLQYVYEHDESLVTNLNLPNEIEKNKQMAIEYNSSQQLNIANQTNSNVSSNEKSLVKILNRCCTSFGKRMFWNWLLCPIVDKNELERRYNSIDFFKNTIEDKKLYIEVRKCLKNMYDIQKYFRKISLDKLTPNEWYNIKITFDNIKHIFELIQRSYKDKTTKIINDTVIDFCNEFILYINENLDIDECSKYSSLSEIKTNIFQKGLYETIDEINSKIYENIDFLKSVSGYINNTINEKEGCKLEITEKQGFYYTITKKRWETFTQKLKQKLNYKNNNYDVSFDLNEFKYDPKNKTVNKTTKRKIMTSLTETINDIDIDFDTIQTKPISSTSSVLKLSSQKIEDVSNNIINKQNELQKLSIQEYKLFLKTTFSKFETNFLEIVNVLSEIDIFTTNSLNSTEFSYNKPRIYKNVNEQCEEMDSFIIAKNMRHPIVEQIQTQTKYIENDLSIGIIPEDILFEEGKKQVKDFDTNKKKNSKGILLYGVNSSGKSTMMKSLGLNIVMAQAGMFVPCSEFIYYPYKHIFTRISGNDNIYKGQSSFTVEMTELKNILNRCNKNSLVLGDELCSGTESISAISIVASGILEIISRNGCFIFATHLHELCDLDVIKDIEISNKLQIFHVHVDCDSNGNIIFNRKLKEGRGSSIYGLEICKYLKLPDQFLKNAEKIRKQVMEISNKLVEPKQSRYNSNVIVSECSICGFIPSKNEKPLETHHITYQKTQNEDKHVKTNDTFFHKNTEHNLAPLCDTCHDKHHQGLIQIYGYIETSNGRKLSFEFINDIQNDKIKKNNTEMIDLEKLKNYISFEKGKWRFRKTSRSKWNEIDENEAIEYLKNKNKIFYLNKLKSILNI